MNISRTYSIEEVLVEKLKDVKNASGLINDLLHQHFKAIIPRTREQIEHRMAEIVIEKKFKADMDKLNAKGKI